MPDSQSHPVDTEPPGRCAGCQTSLSEWSGDEGGFRLKAFIVCSTCLAAVAALEEARQQLGNYERLREALAEAQQSVRELLLSRDSWQRKHGEAMARAGQLHAEAEQMRRLLHALEATCGCEGEALPGCPKHGEMRGLLGDLDAAEKRAERMRPVVEAAQALSGVYLGALRRLSAAVDTYETQTGGTE